MLAGARCVARTVSPLRHQVCVEATGRAKQSNVGRYEVGKACERRPAGLTSDLKRLLTFGRVAEYVMTAHSALTLRHHAEEAELGLQAQGRVAL